VGVVHALRGLDASRYQANAVHALRPHEVWAEDFRALFGGAIATSNGTIEVERARRTRPR
jgi:hypothetical protein